jgi:hypothetical protein
MHPALRRVAPRFGITVDLARELVARQQHSASQHALRLLLLLLVFRFQRRAEVEVQEPNSALDSRTGGNLHTACWGVEATRLPTYPASRPFAIEISDDILHGIFPPPGLCR